MGLNLFTYIKKRNAIPSVKDFPYQHNYNACYGITGKGKFGGHRLDDETTRFDERGVPYKLETEEQRAYRYEKMIKKQEKIKERWAGPKKIVHFIKNLRSRFNWKKLPGKNLRRVRRPDGHFEWQTQYKPVSTKSINKWLNDSNKGNVFKHLNYKANYIVKPDNLDIELINRKNEYK